ncbi:hypothetical protein ACO0LC_17950 [Undibacterium sp. JH2W]|uniref:hypothetical protein n=1 Tax=Undibacterium sp. JH2W TaxID=3413037 RepID=UPI003BF363AF
MRHRLPIAPINTPAIRILLRLQAAAALLFLSACAAPVTTTGNSSQPETDSLRAECPTEVRYAAVAAPQATLTELKTLTEARLAALHLKAVWTVPEGETFIDNQADRLRLQRLLSVVLPALERYPATLFERMRLQHIALVKNLTVAGQRRKAMPAPETDSLVYADNDENICLAGMELRTHHEFYHFIEHRTFGDFYYRDPAWLSLNPATISYGQGGATAYGTGFVNLGHPAAAMVSRYAYYGPEEDKAEMFGWMMTPGYAQRVLQWVGDDTSLAAKHQFMIRFFQEQSSGAMGSDYFMRQAQAVAQ